MTSKIEEILSAIKAQLEVIDGRLQNVESILPAIKNLGEMSELTVAINALIKQRSER